MIWYDMIWYDMIWYDMIWYDTWYDIFFFLFDVFIYLYLGLVGGDKTYKIEPPDPITLSK